MKIDPQKNPGMQKVADLIDDIGPGMLTTHDAHGALTSRPMMPLQIDANGSLWFFTRPSPEKQAKSGELNVAFAKPSSASYVSVTGSSEIVYDRAKVDELWSPMAKPWFPDGKEDPSLALLRVDVETAEYWDSNSSSMVRLISMATAAITGNTPDMGENATVRNAVGAPTVESR